MTSNPEPYSCPAAVAEEMAQRAQQLLHGSGLHSGHLRFGSGVVRHDQHASFKETVQVDKSVGQVESRGHLQTLAHAHTESARPSCVEITRTPVSATRSSSRYPAIPHCEKTTYVYILKCKSSIKTPSPLGWRGPPQGSKSAFLEALARSRQCPTPSEASHLSISLPALPAPVHFNPTIRQDATSSSVHWIFPGPAGTRNLCVSKHQKIFLAIQSTKCKNLFGNSSCDKARVDFQALVKGGIAFKARTGSGPKGLRGTALSADMFRASPTQPL